MRASGYAKAAHDFYREDRRCVDDLIRACEITGPVWDPACGTGNIPEALKAAGLEAFGTDIVDRGYGPVVDFFATDMVVPTVISNPPFGVMEAWVDKALASTTVGVIVLARLAFLEGQARREWFRARPLARVLVSSRRLSMPPGDLDVKARGGATAFSWYIFRHGHAGEPTIGWV